jgi:hypothetical protein
MRNEWAVELWGCSFQKSVAIPPTAVHTRQDKPKSDHKTLGHDLEG